MSRQSMMMAVLLTVGFGLASTPARAPAQTPTPRSPSTATTAKPPVPLSQPTKAVVRAPQNPGARSNIAGPPARPTGLRVVKSGSVSRGGGYDFVGLMWTDNSINEMSYVIERWGGPGCEAGYTRIGSTGANASCFEDIGVDPAAGTYWWKVKACNTRGCSEAAAISIQNDQRNNPVGGTGTLVVPKDPSKTCAEEGGIWLGWGVDYCSHELGTLQSAAQMATNPIVQGYMAYFAVVGGGATMRSLPEDVIQRLKPYYGESLLRDVRYGSSSHTASDGTAMTDCRDIYFPLGTGHVATIKEGALLQRDASGRLVHENTMRLLLHELQHVRQCGDIGGRVNYGIRWFSEMSGTTIVKLITAPTTVSSKTLHDAMPMEADARAKEDLASGL
jgi:hypothetical protein